SLAVKTKKSLTKIAFAWCLWRPEEGVGSLELELQKVVYHDVDAGNWTWFL
ncbi:hypothetical protein STEG23_012646, partial [Scotinomys teguina]